MEKLTMGRLMLDSCIHKGEELLGKKGLTEEQKTWIEDALTLMRDVRDVADKGILGEELSKEDRQLIEMIRPFSRPGD